MLFCITYNNATTSVIIDEVYFLEIVPKITSLASRNFLIIGKVDQWSRYAAVKTSLADISP